MAPLEFTARHDALAALGRLVAFAHAEHIAIRLIVTPYLPEYLAHVTNYEAGLDQIEQATGESVWDAAGIDRNSTHFADRVHLNDEAVKPITEAYLRAGLFDADRAVPGAGRGELPVVQ
jgi:hypothetical protein